MLAHHGFNLMVINMTNVISTEVNGTTYTTVTGVTLNWERLTTAHTNMYGKFVFSAQLEIPTEAREEFKAAVSNFNMEKGTFTAQRMAFTGQPRIVGVDAGTRIGNGSTGDVVLKHMVSKAGICYVALEAVRVSNLVDYDDYVKTENTLPF